MYDFASYIGGVAAVMASLSSIPQVQKAWKPGDTDDLSLGMLITLTTGLALWIIYGLMRGDYLLAAANGIGTCLTGIVLGCKIRDMRQRR